MGETKIVETGSERSGSEGDRIKGTGVGRTKWDGRNSRRMMGFR